MQIITTLSDDSYTDVNTLTGYATTRGLIVTNNTSRTLFLVQSSTEPTAASYQQPVKAGVTVLVEGSDLTLWAKGTTGPVIVQPQGDNIAPFSIVDLPSDVYAGSGEYYRRLQVDEEQASFQDNEQFKYFESWNEREATTVASTDQIVYLIESVNPIYVLRRKLNLWSGGREYQVYPTTGVTFTGTLGDPLPIYTVNNHLRPDLVSHPTSQVTIRKAVGAGIFASGTTRATNGEVVVAPATQGNRIGSTYSPNAEKSGVGAGQSFYLVLDPIGTTDPTNGQLFLLFEEKF